MRRVWRIPDYILIVLLGTAIIAGMFLHGFLSSLMIQAPSKTWIVDDDIGQADFNSIQEAINTANPRDTIVVREGTYCESVLINKTLTLIGEDRNTTIINSSGKGTGVVIKANNVALSGFTIRDCGKYVPPSGAWQGGWIFYEGISVEFLFDGIIIADNRIVNCSVGVHLNANCNSVISGNLVVNNTSGIEIFSYSSNNTVDGNVLTDNSWYGIYVFGGNHGGNIVKGNTVTNHTRGIWIRGSNDNSISRNTLKKNGVFLWGSNGNIVEGNSVEGVTDGLGADWQDYPIGIRLMDSYNNSIEGNEVMNNDFSGIYVDGSGGNSLKGNVITNNAWIGVHLGVGSDGNTVVENNIEHNGYGGMEFASGILLECSDNNTICRNNFVNNAKQVNLLLSYNNTWDNGVEGNCWSDYAGEDLDEDGIGDTPYIIDADNQDNYPLIKYVTFLMVEKEVSEWTPSDINAFYGEIAILII